MTLNELNILSTEDAGAALLSCCGSHKWANSVARRRPFHSVIELEETSSAIFAFMDEEDWLEAFSAHPQIGDMNSLSGEQAGMTNAPEGTRRELAEANRAYLAKFGYIFIICATGKLADDMLKDLKARLGNSPANELAVAAEEQKKITALRLRRMLG